MSSEDNDVKADASLAPDAEERDSAGAAASATSGISRRTFLAGGAAIATGLLFDQKLHAAGLDGVTAATPREHGFNPYNSKEAPMNTDEIKVYDIATNGISLHVTELGEGPVVLFCHGFPDTSYTWRRQMRAIASAGYRAVAPDMRGYGRSSAPEDASQYTPLHTAGDLVGLLDALNIPEAVLVGHDWGATHAWNASLMRPDRFKAVFCLSVPYVPRGQVSVFDKMRISGREKDFYMFEQSRPDADQIWADAAVTIPGILYWASGAAPADMNWNPMVPSRSLYRPAPGPLPAWAEHDYVEHNIAEFKRTGFHGGLNYYRAAEPYFHLSGAWVGAKITRPSFLMGGKEDGLRVLYSQNEDQLRAGIPNLLGMVELDKVGHWIQHEASDAVGEQLVKFLRTVSPT